MTKSENCDASRLADTILVEDSSPDLPQFKYGRAIEKQSRSRYQQYLISTGHKDIQIHSSGLFLDKEHAFVAATPDFLVSCCCGSGLMECKAMYSIRHLDIHKHVPSFLICNEGVISLKVNHPYYAQIQGQMAVTGRSWCDLFVCTNVSEIVIRVSFDEEYWLSLKQNLVLFYCKVIVPRLFSTSNEKENKVPTSTDESDAPKVNSLESAIIIETKLGNDRPSQVLSENTGDNRKQCDSAAVQCPLCKCICVENVKSFKDSSIGCDKCGDWLHFKCVGIRTKKHAKMIEQTEWLCTVCK